MYGIRRINEVRAQLSQATMNLPVGRRRQIVEDGLAEVLRAARQRAWALDDWSTLHLEQAIRVLREGRFDDARHLLMAALTPPDERSGTPPSGKTLTLDDLFVELKKTQVMRIR